MKSYGNSSSPVIGYEGQLSGGVGGGNISRSTHRAVGMHAVSRYWVVVAANYGLLAYWVRHGLRDCADGVNH